MLLIASGSLGFIYPFLQGRFIDTWAFVSFRPTSLALGQSYDCCIASEVVLKEMDRMVWQVTTKNAGKRQSCLYILHLPDINDAAWVWPDNGPSGWDTSMCYDSDRDTSMCYDSDRRYVMFSAISDVGRWRCH